MDAFAFNRLAPVWTRLTQVQPVRAEGIYLYDGDGTAYTDFTSGIGVTNTGHCHPQVVQAIQAQAATGKRNLIMFQGSFHGRTHQAMAMTTSKYIYRYDYQPLPGAVFVAPFPYSYYFGWSEDETVDFCLKQLDQLLHSQTAPDETAAMVIEPVLGEGGYVPAPARFLRALCDRHDILLVVDEVQSGFGRTGRFFCYEHAAASATIDVIRGEGLVEQAARLGDVLQDGLRELQAAYSVMGEVRGRGLMVGVEFTTAEGEPDAATAKAVLEGCLDRHLLLLLVCGNYKNVIRWIVSEELAGAVSGGRAP